MERPNLKICFENDANSDSEDDKPILVDLDEDSETGKSDKDSSSSSSSSDDSDSEGSSSTGSSSSSDESDSERSEAATEATLNVALDQDRKLLQDPRRYENKAGEFVTGFDTLSKEHQEKRRERARRFGIKSPVSHTTEDDVNKLYESLGLSQEDISSGERGIRLEAIHIRGVDNMSTKDVFKYFSEYGPGALEWIDDTSCNVVWLEPGSAARALLNLSSEITDPGAVAKIKSRSRSGSTENKKSDDNKDGAGGEAMDLEEGKSSDEQQGDKETSSKDTGSKTAENQVEKMEEDDFDYNLDLMSDDEDEDKDKDAEKRKNVQAEAHGEDKEVKAAEEMKDSKKSDMETTDKDTGEVTTVDKRTPITYNEAEEVPPGRWRKGVPFLPKAEHLYLRYATKADKKLQGAEKRSKYYQKYGNPNFHGMKGIISESRKRKIRATAYREELANARKMVAKTKHFTGIPEETAFDVHTKGAQRDKFKSRIGRSRGSSDDEGSRSDDDYESNRKPPKDDYSDIEDELLAMLEVQPQSPPTRNPNVKVAQELVPARVPNMEMYGFDNDDDDREPAFERRPMARRQKAYRPDIRQRIRISSPAPSSEPASDGELSHYSSEEGSDRHTDLTDADVDSELRAMLDIPPESPPVKKRFMKMYADEIEEQSQAKGSQSSSVHKRLSGVKGRLSDARSRIVGRKQAISADDSHSSTDLRKRLGRKRQHGGSGAFSGVPSLKIQVEPD